MHFLRLLIFLCITSLYASAADGGLSVAETDSIADKILLTQRKSGGWPKHIHDQAFGYENAWTKPFIEAVRAGTTNQDATIDNDATVREILYLVKAFEKTQNKKYLDAAEKGIEFLLAMQYANGGFPQFFPDTSGYRKHITYNDNAMLNALRVLSDVSEGRQGFDAVHATLLTKATLAVQKGITCILKTQIIVNGKPTVWCAQHDRVTFLPAKARSYELPSFSAAESVDIVRFLMEIKNPSPEIKMAVKGAIDWLRTATILNYKTQRITDPTQPKGRDVVLVPAPGARLWARFYDLDTSQPFFCGRDGVKKQRLSEIENERRVGYAYYGTWPEKLLDETFPRWLSTHE
jgi:PelA/Pel-15E family pectate lyase